MKKETFLKFLTLAVFAFLGSVFSNVVILRTVPALAAQLSPDSYFALHDDGNAKGIESYVYDSYPAQNFYAPDGKIRLQQGIYTAPGEAGLPLTALSDNAGDIRLLLRLAGPNEAPVIIMKDKQGRDRLILGLNMTDAGEEPFLAVIDGNGRKQMVFGSY